MAKGIYARHAMRVLMFSPYPVSPMTHGGRARIAGLARGLAAGGALVTVLSPWHPRQRPDRLGPGVIHRSHRLVTSAAVFAMPSRVAPSQAVLSLEPRWSARRLLRRLGPFDAYQFEFCAHAHWMELVPRQAVVIYSAHNVERDFFAGERRRYLVSAVSGRRIERLEGSAVKRSDLVLACTDEDAARLRSLYGEHRSLVLSNAPSPEVVGMRRDALRASARERLGVAGHERAVLFLGGDAAHNRDAVSFLAREVAPRLGADARLLLAGGSARAAGGHGDGRVLRLGEVEDVRPLLAASDVGVNPVAHGAGSSVKVRDYLAAGLPVLTTEAGARGLRPEDRRVRVVPRQRFAAALAERLPLGGDPAPGADATWEDLGARLRDELETLRAARPRAAPP